jgi:hypothetical protein
MRPGGVFLLCVVALALFGCGSQSPPSLPKSISLSGPQPLRDDRDPNDYRYWGNRAYFKDSHTGWVKLWVSWYDLQQSYPAKSRDGSWNKLSASRDLARLDGQIRAANDDGVRTIVTIYQAFPTWANGATGPDPLSSKGAERKLPSDLSTTGPWAWFVGYLSARYNGAYNAKAPHAPGRNETKAAYYGNPLRARLDAIEVVNEPNTLYWPLDDVVQATATMMRTAAEVSAQWGRQAIIGPATSDFPDPSAVQAGVTMDWRSFTSQLLTQLAGWQPPVPVHWSQHNYADVAGADPAPTSRAKQTIDLLHANNWKELGDRQSLWLTEGGYNPGRAWRDPVARAVQAETIQENFEAMRTLPEVAMWTQHVINDVASNGFKSGLRDDFDYAVPGPGSKRPAWLVWLDL